MAAENGAQGPDFVVDGFRSGVLGLPSLLVGADVTVRDVGQAQPTEDGIEMSDVGRLDDVGLRGPSGLLVREIVPGGDREQGGQYARLDVVGCRFVVAKEIRLGFT